MAGKNVYKVQNAIIEIKSPYCMGKTKALCFDTEYDLIIGNIPRAKFFCTQDRLDDKTYMISGEKPETKNYFQ